MPLRIHNRKENGQAEKDGCRIFCNRREGIARTRPNERIHGTRAKREARPRFLFRKLNQDQQHQKKAAQDEHERQKAN